MIQDFAKRKFDEFIAMVEFPAGRISIQNILNSNLPVYISNFIINCPADKNLPINKNDFENYLNKSIVFNINYIIKPKNTILQFLFGELETRPASYIFNRLQFFQFYEFYITSIKNFINVNNLQVASRTQIEHLINEINKIILDEINNDESGVHQLNLIKLLYYFFYDLTENNPINIKLPKKILSAFFADKNFTEIKSRIDSFFSNDIFIQEAVDLMKPDFINPKHTAKQYTEIDEKVDVFIKQAKEKIINSNQTENDIEKVIADEELNQEINIKLVREHTKEDNSKIHNYEKLSFDEKLYSDDLIFETQLPQINTQIENKNKDKFSNIIDELFYKTNYKKKIIKRIFKNNEDNFNSFIKKIIEQNSWQTASELLNDYYYNNKINLFSEEAVNLVDIIESYFKK
jgi:hypothetical protein